MTDVITEPAGPILRLRGVGRRFGGLHAVRDVDLDVAHGERRAILGPNGAGKTTLFNVISGDMPADLGDDRVPGPGRRRRPAAGPHPARHGAHLPEVAAVPRPERRGQPLPRRARLARGPPAHVPPQGRRRRDARARPRAGQARRPRAPSSPTSSGSISHGEQRQLEVAMARATEPTLMLLDEPASGLSRGERVALTDLLLELDRSITLILIEHDMDVALRVARARHDDARRAQDRGGHARRDPRQRARPRALPRRARHRRRHRGRRHERRTARRRCSRSPASTCTTAARTCCRTSPSRWATSPSRSSAATAWARRRCATRSCRCRPRTTSGSIRFEGTRDRRAARRTRSPAPGIGYVPQGRRLFESLTVDEHLRDARAAARREPLDGRSAVYELFPRLAERKQQRRHAALRRRAADARDRPRAADATPSC